MVKQEHRMCNLRLIFIKRIFTGKKTKVLREYFIPSTVSTLRESQLMNECEFTAVVGV